MRHSNVLFYGVLLTLLLISGGAKYYKYMILRDYSIITTTTCNPKVESCFVDTCEEANCFPEPYKYLEKKAHEFNSCNPYEQECPREECSIELGCIEILCSEETLSEEERCVTES
jgi:hypothetical protein